jgi:hypothetical protein
MAGELFNVVDLRVAMYKLLVLPWIYINCLYVTR